MTDCVEEMKPVRLIFRWILVAFVLLALSPVTRADTAPQADRLLIEKSKRTLTLYQQDKVFKTYKIALGREPVGAKTQQGDGKTPEGNYVIVGRNKNSHYHRSLQLSYPNAQDLQRARALGVSPGGLIMIHGLPNGWGPLGTVSAWTDWTEGCIAVSNEEIEEIWQMVPDGTAVEIVP